MALVDEAKKNMDIVSKAYNNSIWNSLERLPIQIDEIVGEAKDVLTKASKAQNDAIQAARKIAEMAKELGVETPKEAKAIFDNSDYDDLANGYEKQLSKIASTIKKY